MSYMAMARLAIKQGFLRRGMLNGTKENNLGRTQNG